MLGERLIGETSYSKRNGKPSAPEVGHTVKGKRFGEKAPAGEVLRAGPDSPHCQHTL